MSINRKILSLSLQSLPPVANEGYRRPLTSLNTPEYLRRVHLKDQNAFYRDYEFFNPRFATIGLTVQQRIGVKNAQDLMVTFDNINANLNTHSTHSKLESLQKSQAKSSPNLRYEVTEVLSDPFISHNSNYGALNRRFSMNI